MQDLPVQALADERAHQVARLVARFAAAVIVGREVEERAAADHEIAMARAHRPAVGLVDVRARRLDRRAALRLAVKKRRIAELGEQALLEAAQHRRKGFAAREARERLAVSIEERFVWILARQEAQDQLIEVEAAHQAAPGEGLQTAGPF